MFSVCMPHVIYGRISIMSRRSLGNEEMSIEDTVECKRPDFLKIQVSGFVILFRNIPLLIYQTQIPSWLDL